MTEPEDPDSPLRRGFENLRQHEANDAPAFDATWAAAEQRVRDRRRRVAAIAGFSTLVAAAAALLLVFAPPRAINAPADLEEASMFAPPSAAFATIGSPTDFLLAPPTEPPVDLTLGIDPFRYELDRLIERETGVAP